MAKLVFLVFGLIIMASSLEAGITETFREQEIVPQIISEAPKKSLKVSYSSDNKVTKGNTLTPTQVKDVPKVEYKAESSDYYTLMMIDPDAPSAENPSRRSWLHWLVANIPGNEISRGDVLAEYIGSGPPKGTGYHRYIFLLYKQNGRIESFPPKISKTSSRGRPNFNPNDFAKKYELGNPILGNFYKAEYDDYVPTLHSQIQRN